MQLQNEAEEEEMETGVAPRGNLPEVYAHATQVSEESTQSSGATTCNASK